MHVFIKVNKSILILICCNKESTELFLRYLREHLSHFWGIYISILVVVKWDEIILVLFFSCFLVFTKSLNEKYYTGPREASPNKIASDRVSILILLIIKWKKKNNLSFLKGITTKKIKTLIQKKIAANK